MKTLLHIGMHKTGSSSIQETLQSTDLPGCYYPDWGRGNLSGLATLLFTDRPERQGGFRVQGLNSEDLHQMRAEWQARIGTELASGRYQRFIFSAERLSTLHITELTRLRDLISPHCDEIRVIGYVRPPVSFLTSAFQQMVKGGRGRISLSEFWPAYRKRLAKFDALFGRENVSLRRFAPDALEGGNVVLDFAYQAGLDIPAGNIRHVNESLSLEATALLFVQRRFGRGLVRGFRHAGPANKRFVAALQGVGRQRLALAPALTDPVLQENAADLDWAEARLGEPLRDTAPETGQLVGSEEELIAVALENGDAVAQLLEDRFAEKLPETGDPLAGLTARLEALYRQQTEKAGRKPSRRSDRNRGQDGAP